MTATIRWPMILATCLACLVTPGCDWLDDHNWGELGMVVDSSLGCWLIVTGDINSGDATSYEPTNLEERFRVDGLWIRFEYVLPDEWVSICMVGEPIAITRIEKL